MKKLIILRGAPGSGKSHTIHQLGLNNHQLSMDAIRRVIGGVDMLSDGTWSITQAHNQRVAAQFKQLIAERMSRGETLAIESVFAYIKDLEEIMRLARDHRYDVAIIDFSSMPQEQIIAQNQQREEINRLNESAMERWLEAVKNQGPVPKTLAPLVVQWDADGAYLDRVKDFLVVPVLDISSYDKAVFIGDIQGCADPLIGKGGLLEGGFKEDTFYLFMGDFLDRGPQNGEVMRWIVNEALPRHGQVRWLHGNHEDHLHRWARGWPAVSAEFQDRTLPQLIKAGITPKDADAVCAKADEVLLLNWRGQKIMATHAGLPTVPPRLGMVSGYQLSHGTGSWSDPVDYQFSRLAPSGWMQVHGHRNHKSQKVIATPESINLEDGVDKGGALRAAILDENGWTPVEIPNEHFVDIRMRRPKKHADWAPSWLSEPRNTKMPDEVLTQMREHSGVQESISKTMPHIASLNFTRHVFFEKSWDDVSVRARGLFFDRNTGEVVCRGYDKFFNIGERVETTMESLSQTLKFPVVAYLKENGYLGNLGFDDTTKQLVFASKSTPDSNFAAWFKEIFEATTTEVDRENIRRFMRNFECSMVFEVIDPVRDPHMVDYAAPKLVLLDVFHRSISGQKLPYDDLKKVGASLGLEVKQRAMKFSNFDQMKGFLDSKEGDLNWRFEGKDIEGFVFEDASGFQTKDKATSYSFWKDMRGTKDRLVRLLKEKDEIAERPNQKRAEIALYEVDKKIEGLYNRKPHPLSRLFIQWLREQPKEHLQQDILTLKKEFMVAVNPSEDILSTPWIPYADAKPSRKMTP